MGLPDDVKLSNNVNKCKHKDHLLEPLPPPPAYLILPNVPNLRLVGRPVSLGPKSNWFKHEQFNTFELVNMYKFVLVFCAKKLISILKEKFDSLKGK